LVLTCCVPLVCSLLSQSLTARFTWTRRVTPGTSILQRWLGLLSGPRNLGVYKKAVDVWFSYLNKNQIRLHCLVVKSDKIDYDLYSAGDSDIGFTKFIYMILMKFARQHAKVSRFYVYPDERRTRQPPDKFCEILNYGALKHPEIKCAPFRLVEFHNSKKCVFVQMADVLIGAVAYKTNGHEKRFEAGTCKKELADYMGRKANIGGLDRPTPFRQKAFTIWHFKSAQK
jgi:hypothetical protein